MAIALDRDDGDSVAEILREAADNAKVAAEHHQSLVEYYFEQARDYMDGHVVNRVQKAIECQVAAAQHASEADRWRDALRERLAALAKLSEDHKP